MPNEKNLEKGKATQFRSGEEAARNGKNGGIASGIARRRRKSFKEAVELYLSMPPSDQERVTMLAEMGIPNEDIDNRMVIVIGLAQAAASGDHRAANTLRDFLEEKSGDSDGNVRFINESIVTPKLYEARLAIQDGGIDEFLAKGGRGSTKSSFISVELIRQLVNHPDCHAAVFRKVANTLRTSVYAQVCWAITQMGLSEEFHCTVSPMECTFKRTGQKIMFFGLDDPGKVKSIKVPFGYIGLAWFEELDQFSGPEEVRNVEQSILRGGAYSMTFKSFNPPAMQRNWANQYALEHRPGKLVHHSTYLDVPINWLGPRFLADAEHLQRTNETAYRHEYLGEVVGCGTQVFDNLRIEDITDEQINAFDRCLNGVDWGWYPDPFAYNRMHYDAARKILYIFDEIRVNKMRNKDTAELVKNKIQPEEIVIADSAESKSVSDYKSFGIRCRGAEKGAGSVRYSMKWLQSLKAIVIDPYRCPNTAKEFGEYEYERDKKTGEIIDDYPDVANHHIDAVRYATNGIWKRRGQ